MLRCEDYTVGWVCALSVELAAAEELLDEEHETPEYDARDTNIYTCGRVGEHNVVIACLPEGRIGTNSAAAVAVQMKSTFTSTRFGLMVGIGGISADSRARDMSAYERPCIGCSLAIRVYPIRFCKLLVRTRIRRKTRSLSGSRNFVRRRRSLS